ncbi:hypothetical protein PGT21_024517 [Puccinia graminis f. sp. tritici]|uniref:Uncharacterized protein n=1 Tax=Puccinia graminis f. sp. tritici TaxID=56615 RepID=A0A5B0LWB0_PUCGR|nr:hypothetical protein PGT21_024517 [Puccinia graminis f. sp. tritici]
MSIVSSNAPVAGREEAEEGSTSAVKIRPFSFRRGWLPVVASCVQVNSDRGCTLEVPDGDGHRSNTLLTRQMSSRKCTTPTERLATGPHEGIWLSPL